jgi:hypothetical protein
MRLSAKVIFSLVRAHDWVVAGRNGIFTHWVRDISLYARIELSSEQCRLCGRFRQHSNRLPIYFPASMSRACMKCARVPSSQGEPYSFVSKLQILSSQALRIELQDSVYDAAQIFASIISSDKIVWPSQRGKKHSAFVVFGLFSRTQMLVVSQQSHVPEKGKRASDESISSIWLPSH